MSDAAWGLSFGKFLELSFSNHAAASRVASCGHSLHRDCLRFYGYGSFLTKILYMLLAEHRKIKERISDILALTRLIRMPLDVLIYALGRTDSSRDYVLRYAMLY